MDGLLQDIRFAFRMLLKNAWFSAVVILVMAVGIGGTTAMFSVVDALLVLTFRPPHWGTSRPTLGHVTLLQ